MSHTSLWHQSSVTERKKLIAKLCGHQVLPNLLTWSHSPLWVWGFHDSKYTGANNANKWEYLIGLVPERLVSISLCCRLSTQNKCHLFPPLQCQTTLSWSCWQNAWAPWTAWPMAGCSLASPGMSSRESSCRKHRLIPTGKAEIQPPHYCRYEESVCGKIQIFIDILYAAASWFLLP